MAAMTSLDLTQDVASLTASLVDIESVSGNEKSIADAVEAALRPLGHLDVSRHGDTIVARTHLGMAERVAIAGHLDTVPLSDNLPSRVDADNLYGLGACDMKGGVAIALKLASSITAPNREVTYVFYECEEVEAVRNGLGRLATSDPELLEADFAVLMEPSNALVEAGCQGSMRIDIVVPGVRAHSARWWMGVNAIHGAGEVIERLLTYAPRSPVVDGLRYREGLNAVEITGGVAGNVLPDECRVSVNYRFAPNRTEDEAMEHLRELFDGFEIELVDSAPGAMPGLDRPAAAAFVQAIGGAVNPKFGWTDVARFSVLGVPAVNFGPGDPQLAHSRDEYVPLSHLRSCEEQMTTWLTD
jgi:succinyl-diaminopimelate desuccinylase